MKQKEFINSLTPVKKIIANLLINEGLNPKQVARRIAKKNKSLVTSKAYVTMVIQDMKAKKIKLANLDKKAPKTKVEKVKAVEIVSAETKPASTYNYVESRDKEKAAVRRRVVEEVFASKLHAGLVLTLSWIKCFVETEANKFMKDLRFLSCEKDLETFKELQKNIASTNLKNFMLSPIMSEIGQIIRVSGKDKFAHLFLDYCGSLISYENDIKTAILNDIVQVNGIIWVTVCNRGVKDTLQKLEAIMLENGQDKYIKLDGWNYRDTGGMTTIFIQRIK